MLAIVYLLLCTLFGISFVGLLVPDVRRLYVASAQYKKSTGQIPSTLFTVPAGIIVGMVAVSFFHYFATLGLSYLFDDGNIVLRISTLLTFAFFLWLILSNIVIINRRRIKREEEFKDSIELLPQFNYELKNTLFFGIITVFIAVITCFLMFYTFRIKGNELYSGFSTFSDFAPHTAMVSSFGKGFNFPTQYMHYSGDGIQYHFFFYYLCGMLEYLGLPLDFAINIPSIVAMTCALVLLGLLAMLISGKKLAYALAPLFVFLRSSLNVFIQIKNLMGEGKSIQSAVITLLNSDSWSDITPFDNWGVWAINVYANQRHLMLGIALILILIILYLPFVRRMCISLSQSEGVGDFFKRFLFSRNAWLPRTGDPIGPVHLMILSVAIVAMMPYFHGSALIAGLLVLFGMAIISETRLVYLATAGVAVGLSFLQTAAFSGGAKNVFSMKFKPGFVITEELSVQSVAKYILIVTGLTVVLAFICALVYLIYDIVKKKPVHRFILFICFLFPGIFGFLFQISLEMLANHKFIQITLILLDVFVASLMANLFVIPFKVKKLIPEEEETVAEVAATEPETKPEEEESVAASDIEISETSSDSEIEETVSESKKEDIISETSSDSVIEETISAINEIKFGDDEIDKEDEVKCRPGNEVLPAEVQDLTTDFVFNDEIKEELEKKPEETAEEEKPEEKTEDKPEVIDDLKEETDEEEEKTESEEPKVYEHKEVLPKYTKGIPLPAFIVLEILGVILGLALLVPLLATGVSEWCTYINLNKSHVTVRTDSPLTKWIIENTEPDDVFLTPMWSMDRFYLAGRPSYYGWPYYAWSAGHDTETREIIYNWLVTGCEDNYNEFLRYCKERNIRYVIADAEFLNSTYGPNEEPFNAEFFAEHLQEVAYFADDNNTIIYKVY